ncbi:unnamed protein product, partial [marine sediment metagenome]
EGEKMDRTKKSARKHPIERVEWVNPDALHANDYNPNTVFSPELKLLKESLLQDGWTTPLVITYEMEIVDGFHRWTLATGDEEVRALAGGLVPVVYLEKVSRGGQIMATVRHNRARGVHGVLKMADLVRELIDEQGMTEIQVQKFLGMGHEEVDRLYDRGGMTERGAGDEFGKAWVPTRDRDSSQG